MYSNPGAAIVPMAATAVALTSPTWLFALFAFCACFAIIGAVFAFKRTLPVPSFVHDMRMKRAEKKLKGRLDKRNS